MGEMEPHQIRVVEEKAALDEKIAKLEPFINGPIYTSLPIQEQERLKIQLEHMKAYSFILGERIAAF